MADAEEGPIVLREGVNGDPELGLTNNLPPPPDYGTSVNISSPKENEAPPPRYEDVAKEAPPSYQDIFGQMQDAKKSSSTPMEFIAKIISILLSTLLVTIVIAILLAIPIAMIVLGAVYMKECPVEPKIPVYLVVAGSFYILKSFIDLITRCQKRDQNEGEASDETINKKNNFSRLIGCFLFAFFIAGNVWVYSNYPPSANPDDPEYCFGPLYYFAFWIITSCYILVACGCLCVCCAAGVTSAVSE
ncbi:transmembrane protein 272-like [Asterias amurensis]|uniref:transmembrane protein 272-like n=1 Tax=Asterias amurensis TaxID=7602 RepID=UPI003AB699A9